MSRKNLEVIYEGMLERALDLQGRVQDGEKPSSGICYHLNTRCGGDYNRIRYIMIRAFKGWKGYDKSYGIVYPVGGQAEYDQERFNGKMFDNHRRNWLLNHLITKLRKGPTWREILVDWLIY